MIDSEKKGKGALHIFSCLSMKSEDVFFFSPAAVSVVVVLTKVSLFEIIDSRDARGHSLGEVVGSRKWASDIV